MLGSSDPIAVGVHNLTYQSADDSYPHRSSDVYVREYQRARWSFVNWLLVLSLSVFKHSLLLLIKSSQRILCWERQQKYCFTFVQQWVEIFGRYILAKLICSRKISRFSKTQAGKWWFVELLLSTCNWCCIELNAAYIKYQMNCLSMSSLEMHIFVLKLSTHQWQRVNKSKYFNWN